MGLSGQGKNQLEREAATDLKPSRMLLILMPLLTLEGVVEDRDDHAVMACRVRA